MTRRARVVVGAVALVCGLAAVWLILLVVLGDLDSANQAESIIGVLLGLGGFVVSVYALFRPSGDQAPGAMVETRGSRSIAAGGHIGRAVTGDGLSRTTASAPAAPPFDRPPTGPASSVRASGERGIAAGGSIGEAVTGDEGQS
ncbi:hypothetical protein ACWEQ2_09205 [Streptomyces sp. NPDC004096]|uniref:hypothetical protein n=1 Tax=unclassified Streptomyces TaxID=2593676 RepID=UPI0033B9A90F